MTDIHRLLHVRLAPSPGGQPISGSIKAIVRVWASRIRSRRDIAHLDERSIRDLGLSVSQLEFEAGKPFWRA